MDTQLAQVTDLVKDYAKIIDELREENKTLKSSIHRQQEIIKKLQDELDQLTIGYDQYAIRTIERIITLEQGIEQTLEKNRHLADGDDCTLLKLKQLVHWK